MNIKRLRLVADISLVFLFLLCVLFTWRSCGESEEAKEQVVPATVEPTPTPEAVDPYPVRTVMIAAMTFFEHIAGKRYDEAAGMFAEEQARKDWLTNLNRVDKYGNPIASFKIEKRLENQYCRISETDADAAQCEFPIQLIRRDNEVSEYATVKMDLIKADKQWKILHYLQEKTDKEAYESKTASPEEPVKQTNTENME